MRGVAWLTLPAISSSEALKTNVCSGGTGPGPLEAGQSTTQSGPEAEAAAGTLRSDSLPPWICRSACSGTTKPRWTAWLPSASGVGGAAC